MTKYEICILLVGIIGGTIGTATILLINFRRQKSFLKEATKQAAFLDGVLTDLDRRLNKYPFFSQAYKAAVNKVEKLILKKDDE